jgi:8-amino-7-oxononanoate synthase
VLTLFGKLHAISDRLAAFGDGPLPFDTVIEEVLGPTEVVIAGRRTLMCGSNNYFGLSFHPAVLEASRLALERHGAGTTGSRAANGTYAAHRRLEAAFAARYGKRHGLVFTTGYQANLGLIAGLCGPDDTILLDAESHASIYDGARLSSAQTFAFRHNSAADLARKLARRPEPGRCLVVVEGLYSISGDTAPLAEIADVCRSAGACLMVDEAHSFGAYGERGLGRAEADGVLPHVDFIVGTFSKALAGVGGFCVSDHEALRLLHFAARPYVFTASGSPANIAGVEAALAVLEATPELREQLWSNVRRARAGLSRLGFSIGRAESPIVPITIGDADRAVAFWRGLLEAGLYANIVLPPGCPPDGCLLRTSYTAAHTAADIDRALSIFERVGRELSIIDAAA